MPRKRIKMPRKPKVVVIPKAKPRAKQPKPTVIPKAKPKPKPKPKPKKPFLRRVKAAVREAVMGAPGKGGSTVGTQQKQIRDLGLMDDEDFKRLK